MQVGSNSFTNVEKPLTFNTPLLRTGDVISIPLATGTANGYLSSADWTKFNTAANSTGQAASATTSGYLLMGDWTTFNNKQNTLAAATGTTNGYLTMGDWTTFNGKENVLSFTAPLARSTNTISIPVANTTTNGYLSSADWNTFTNKWTLNGAKIYYNTGNVGIGTNNP